MLFGSGDVNSTTRSDSMTHKFIGDHETHTKRSFIFGKGPRAGKKTLPARSESVRTVRRARAENVVMVRACSRGRRLNWAPQQKNRGCCAVAQKITVIPLINPLFGPQDTPEIPPLCGRFTLFLIGFTVSFGRRQRQSEKYRFWDEIDLFLQEFLLDA